jgi:hypothetical protein
MSAGLRSAVHIKFRNKGHFGQHLGLSCCAGGMESSLATRSGGRIDCNRRLAPPIAPSWIRCGICGGCHDGPWRCWAINGSCSHLRRFSLFWRGRCQSIRGLSRQRGQPQAPNNLAWMTECVAKLGERFATLNTVLVPSVHLPLIWDQSSGY